MSDRIHRIVMFASAILVGVTSYTALGDVMSKEAIGWLAFVTFVVTLIGNSWRVLFPDSGSGA